MKVVMLTNIQTQHKTFKKGDVVEVRPHETIKGAYYVEGLSDRELFLNDTPIFQEVKEKAA